jgi:hypothetical protein
MTDERVLEVRLAFGEENAFYLRPYPASNSGFQEIGNYLIVKPGAGWSLLIDDETLVEDEIGWRWTPGFFAGEVTAELIRPDGVREAVYLLDVSPDPRKLGRDGYAEMMRELWAEDPKLVFGTEPATAAIGVVGEETDAWLLFWRFRTYAPQVLRALAQIRAMPRRGLVARRQFISARRVRHADRQTTRSALRHPSTLALLARRTELEESGAVLDCPHVEESTDCAANRCLLVMVRALARRAISLIEALDALVESERQSETRTPLQSRWSSRRQVLLDLNQSFKRATASIPFAGLSRAEITAAGLNAIAADPSYARAYRLAWSALRAGASGPPTDERLWVSPSWEIYERWCFVAVGRLLRSAFPALSWHRTTGIETGSWRGMTDDGLDGLRLDLQSKFRSQTPDSTGAWSVSKERRPDLVLSEVHGETISRFWVIDAKYRAARANVLDAMATAHIYQDSLRIRDLRPVATWLFVPAGGGAPWLEDPTFPELQGVGVHAMSPSGQQALPVALRRALASKNQDPWRDRAQAVELS